MGNRTLFLASWGFTAAAIAQRFAHEGWHILASTRQTDTADHITALGFEPILIAGPDVDRDAQLALACQRADAIVITVPPVGGVDPFIDAFTAMSQPLPWLGYLSTTGVYGDYKGDWVDEASPLKPDNQRSIDRVAAEQGWQSLGARIFRLPGIYGPGRNAFTRLRAGAPVYDKPGHVFSRVHIDDIAGAIWCAVNRPDIEGVFNIADNEPASQVELMQAAAKMIGAPAPDIRPYDPEAMTPMQASFYTSCRRVSNARAKSVLGWSPVYASWREGLRADLNAEGGGVKAAALNPG